MVIGVNFELFCREYVRTGGDGAAAVRLVYKNVDDDKKAKVRASQLLKRGDIQLRVAELQKEVVREIGFDARELTDHWRTIIQAEAADLIQVVRDSCRFCYGKDHHYQWSDKREFAIATAKWIDANPDAKHERGKPKDKGGYGYDPRVAPNEQCPSCYGRGITGATVTATRDLTPAQRKLFAGVKISKNGSLEILTRNQDAAEEKLAKALGMYGEKTPDESTDPGALLRGLVDHLPD